MAKPPTKRASSQEVAAFLNKSKAIAQVVEKQPRLLFGIDATASRQPTWDSACHHQQAMFLATAQITTLSVQLCYYRGFHQFKASRWLNDSQALAQLMGRVRCEGGHTQIARLLKHALGQHQQMQVRAVVFIGDAIEESVDTLCDLAGQCGLLKLPLFIFQEGRDARVEDTFRSMARLSGGAYARFNAASAKTLAELLGAVAAYAAGGQRALEKRTGENAKLLLQQLKQ